MTCPHGNERAMCTDEACWLAEHPRCADCGQRGPHADQCRHVEGSITDEWLKAVGFRQQPPRDRQPTPHYLLWLGNAGGDETWMSSFDDAGIELCSTSVHRFTTDPHGQYQQECYFAFLRSDVAQSRGRFVFIRYVRTKADVIQLAEAISGVRWDARFHRHGGIEPARLRKATRS